MMTSTMHVGLVTRGDVGYTLDVANQLHAAGLTVSLYMCYDHAVNEVGDADRPVERLYEKGLVPPGCNVHLVKMPRKSNPRSAAVSHRLSRKMRADGIDLAHLLVGPDELWLAVLAWLLCNVPLVTTMIVPNPHKGENIPQFMMVGIQQLLASASDMIIVNGENLVELVQTRYSVSPERVLYVPLSARSMATPWADETLNEEPCTVLFFGRATPHKGLEYLVRAQPFISEQLPNARVLISAHGPELARCRQLIEDHDRFEINEGIVPGDVMAAYFRRASVVALPYLSAASSGVLMTAYNFGKPVVASDIGGLSEYIEDGQTGLLVPPTNVEELAGAIVRLLTDDTLRQRMGQNAQRWVDEQQERITRLTLEAYERTLAHYSKKRCVTVVKETTG